MQTVSVDRLVGQILGQYRVERLLGQGRLNAVYLARGLAEQNTVALTLFIIPERFSPDARSRFLRRFHKEADALTTLQHPHILPVYEYGEHAGYPYLVTPYMMNGSLADILKRKGRLSHERVLTILDQMTDGLEYAHNKGVIHGTLKPSNIVLSTERTMQVAGFGLMHIQQMRGIEPVNQPYGHLLSVADTFLVAPEYIAPEIVQGQSIDARSDIYALGIILFELLCGEPPFKGASPLEVARMHVEQLVPSLRAACPDVPVALASVVNQALDRDPARRFQHVGELVEAFAQVSRGATVPLASISGEAKSPSPRNKEARHTSPDSWQLVPPIVTGKLAAVPKPAKAGNPGHRSQPAARSSDANSGPRQFRPPGVTGQLAQEPSHERARPVTEDLPASPKRSTRSNLTVVGPHTPRSAPEAGPVWSPAPPTPLGNFNSAADLVQRDEWWTQPAQEPLFLHNPEAARWDPGTYASDPKVFPPVKRSRSSTPSRPRRVKRRGVVALLAAGGVAAVGGGAFFLNAQIMHTVNNLLHTPTLAQASHTAVATPTSAQGNNNKASTPNQQQNMPARPVIGSTKQPANSQAIFTNPADKKVSLLIHLPTGNFTAYERACTHEGVFVNYDQTTHTLVCPAHGAIFDPTNGAVIQGPATKPLPKVTIRVNTDGTITTV